MFPKLTISSQGLAARRADRRGGLLQRDHVVGHEARRELNPGLIYCSITGFG